MVRKFNNNEYNNVSAGMKYYPACAAYAGDADSTFRFGSEDEVKWLSEFLNENPNVASSYLDGPARTKENFTSGYQYCTGIGINHNDLLRFVKWCNKKGYPLKFTLDYSDEPYNIYDTMERWYPGSTQEGC